MVELKPRVGENLSVKVEQPDLKIDRRKHLVDRSARGCIRLELQPLVQIQVPHGTCNNDAPGQRQNRLGVSERSSAAIKMPAGIIDVQPEQAPGILPVVHIDIDRCVVGKHKSQGQWPGFDFSF